MIKLTVIQSEVGFIPEISKEEELVSLLPAGQEYHVLSYQDNALLMGTYKDGSFCFFDNNLFSFSSVQKIRIFNRDKEWLLWRTGVTYENGTICNHLTGRIRTDGIGDTVYVKEINQLLVGTKQDSYNNGFERLFEDRGFEIVKPLLIPITTGKRMYQAVLTRNYLEQWDNGQLSYCDARMLDYVYVEEDKND